MLSHDLEATPPSTSPVEERLRDQALVLVQEEELKAVPTPELEEASSAAPADSPVSSLSSPSTVVSLPEYLLERSPLPEEEEEEEEESPRVISPLHHSPAGEEASLQQTSYTVSSFEPPTEPSLTSPPPSLHPPSPPPSITPAAPNSQSSLSSFSQAPEEEDLTSAPFLVGQRVIVGNTVEGVVRYYGETAFASGVWVGVELDAPRGKNDGAVAGHRYFSCLPRYGVFAPPFKVALLTPSVSASSSASILDVYELFAAGNPSSEDLGQPPAQWQREEEGTMHVSASASTILTEDLTQLMEENYEEQADHLSDQMVRQLSNESFNAVHDVWMEVEWELEPPSSGDEWELEPPALEEEWELEPSWEEEGAVEERLEEDELTAQQLRLREVEETANEIADHIIDLVVGAEVDLMCNILAAKIPTLSPPPPPLHEDKAPSPPPPPEEVTPLCMVPGSRTAIDTITSNAWDAVWNSACGNVPVLPSRELITELCGHSSNHCQEAFIHLVFKLAVETIQEDRRGPCGVGTLASFCSPRPLTLQGVQESVYKQLTSGQQPIRLPPLKYLHNNCRPGGKEVDFVDSILIRELREEEAEWVDYSQEEEEVKDRTSKAILDMLLDETVEILDSIEQKRQQCQ